MTVSSQTQFANLVGNGTAFQVFPFAFRCLSSAFLAVEFRRGAVVTPLALNVDYTVFLNADQEANPGGTITMTDAAQAAPVAATTVSIVSAAPYVQQLDLPTGGSFSAAAVELQLDNLAQQIQQLRDALSSTLRARPGDTIAAVPPAASRANTLQGYDSAGAPLLYANASSISLVSQVQGPFGSAALPGYSFAGRTNDGVYSVSAGAVGISAGGVQRAQFDSTGVATAFGSAAAPGYNFIGRVGDGMFSAGANTLAWATGGVQRMVLDSAGGLDVGPGTAALPSFSFLGDTNTGVYSPGADTWAVATNGVQRFAISASGTATYPRDGGGEIGWRAPPTNVQAGNYTLLATDNGKVILLNAGLTVTVPAGVFTTDTQLFIYNNAGGVNAIAQGAGLTLRFGPAGTGNRSIANNGFARLYFINSAVAMIDGSGVS